MPDDEPQSIESTFESREETSLSRSRRGFLRKAAATGIVGLTGMTAATQAARACLNPYGERYRLYAGEEATFRAGRNDAGSLTLEGYADESDYHLDSPYELWEVCGVERGDEMNKYQVGSAYGEVNDRYQGSGVDEPGFRDQYTYIKEIYCEVTTGAVDVTNSDKYDF